MGLFTPKYPEGAEPPRYESPAGRKAREGAKVLGGAAAAALKGAHRAGRAGVDRLLDAYEERHGLDPIDQD